MSTQETQPTTTTENTTPVKPTRIAFTLNDINAATFIKYFSRHLRRTGKIELPKYVDSIKTGCFCYNGPANPDWYYVRAASIIRRIYLTPGIGVGALRHIYGSLNRRTKGRPHHTPASGGIIRHVFHQLEKLQLVEKTPNGGRRVTKTGRRDLDRISAQIGLRLRRI